jgi:hypothetical protein
MKTKQIIEANKLYKELKGFIQWIGFFMIIGGVGLIIYDLVKGIWLR